MEMTRRSSTAMAGTMLTASMVADPGRSHAALPSDGDLVRTLEQIERRLSARLGVAILDGHAGREWTYRADERFPLCSTFKVVAVGALLWRVDRG